MYSVDKAVGLIIGNGNVGKYLTEDEEEVATFLSRDGGLTWAEVSIILYSRLERDHIFTKLEITED